MSHSSVASEPDILPHTSAGRRIFLHKPHFYAKGKGEVRGKLGIHFNLTLSNILIQVAFNIPFCTFMKLKLLLNSICKYLLHSQTSFEMHPNWSSLEMSCFAKNK